MSVVERSPAGDTREHPVPCKQFGCWNTTFNHSRSCWRHLLREPYWAEAIALYGFLACDSQPGVSLGRAVDALNREWGLG